MHCGSCGISLEPDFDDEDGIVCAQCKAQTKGRVGCDFFEIIDWDESTNTVLHAVCTMPSPCWPNCNRCQDKVEYADTGNTAPTSNPVLMSSAKERLLNTDAELLGKSPDAMVRQEPEDDAEVKRLYDIWKSL
jgi:hypothetical protein